MRTGLFLLLIALQACGGVSAGEAEMGPAPSEGEVEESSLPRVAVTNTNGDISADAGYIADGDVIAIPAGFSADQCVFTAAPASVSGSAISTRATVNRLNGVVTCKQVVQERKEVQPTTKGCTASYTVICAQ